MKLASTDSRTQKTLATLHTAFLALLLEREYETLKVEDIVERANVARSTFYQHFRTKNDLLRASMRTPFSILADVVGPADDGACIDRVVRLLMHLRENQGTLRVLLRWPTRQLLAEVLGDQIAERLRRFPDLQTVLPAEIIARQIGDHQLALLEYWGHGRPVCAAMAVASALIAGSKALTNALVLPASP
jgi:AcrR family transcriptional regulator